MSSELEAPQTTWPLSKAGSSTSHVGPLSYSASPYGKGKRSATVLADQGNNMLYVTDLPYSERIKGQPFVTYKGSRVMHRSTLKMSDLGPRPLAKLQSTSAFFHGGKHDLASTKRPAPVPSQHISQFKFGDTDAKVQKDTSYNWDYKQRDNQALSDLKRWTFNIRRRNLEGSGVYDRLEPLPYAQLPNPISEYTANHSKLGAALGPGVPYEPVPRCSYNIITGQEISCVLPVQYNRTSGNRGLHSTRQSTTDCLLG